MQLRIKNMPFRLDFLTLLFPLTAILLGEGHTILLLTLSLSAHETAHLLATYAAKASVRSMRLTPFGAILHLNQPYLIPPARLIFISAAGPAANLFIILLSTALCHWHLLNPIISIELLQLNLIMLVFNLLPALPLDGGRILYAILSMRLPRKHATEIGIWIGRILACSLVILSLWGFFAKGLLNLSPLFAAVLLLSASGDERKSLADSNVQHLLDSMLPLREPTHAELLAIDSSTPLQEALNASTPGRITLFAIFHRGNFVRLIDNRTLIRCLVENTPTVTDKKIQKI